MPKKKTKRKQTAARKSSAAPKKRLKPPSKLKLKSKSKQKKVAKPQGKSKPRASSRRGTIEAELVSYEPRGLGARTGGQSGDTQGIGAGPDADSESVEELLEEGQSFEAEVVNGVENAPDADQGEVRTHEVPEDDVPEEYREKD